MKRRNFIISLAALALMPPMLAYAEEWETRLIKSLYDEELYYGLHIKLAPTWKTYWRVPGTAGIPPLITLEGPDIDDLEVDYPLPMRTTDESGDSIGYHDEVVFLLRPFLKSGVAPDKAKGKVKARFGVCQNICRPAMFEADLSSAVTDDDLMEKYIEKVPDDDEFVSSAKQDGATLTLAVKKRFSDIFVEGPDALYFGKPEFISGAAKFAIAGLTEGQKLSGQELRITAAMFGGGLEQTITVT